MPSELELNRVINNIQELLYSASDVSHDRCVKVLTARAKVGALRHAAAVSRRRCVTPPLHHAAEASNQTLSPTGRIAGAPQLG